MSCGKSADKYEIFVPEPSRKKIIFCMRKKLPAGNWKYKAHNSKYVWDNLKYLRHIFCHIYTCWLSSAWPLTVFVCKTRLRSITDLTGNRIFFLRAKGLVFLREADGKIEVYVCCYFKKSWHIRNDVPWYRVCGKVFLPYMISVEAEYGFSCSF